MYVSSSLPSSREPQSKYSRYPGNSNAILILIKSQNSHVLQLQLICIWLECFSLHFLHLQNGECNNWAYLGPLLASYLLSTDCCFATINSLKYRQLGSSKKLLPFLLRNKIYGEKRLSNIDEMFPSKHHRTLYGLCKKLPSKILFYSGNLHGKNYLGLGMVTGYGQSIIIFETKYSKNSKQI